MDVPQFLTSAQCLDCRACCLFHDPSGDWAPRLTPEDVLAIGVLAEDIPWRDGAERVALCSCRGANACIFLDAATHHCRIYTARPLECRLYPFLLSHEKTGFRIYAHISCPAVMAERNGAVWERRVALIRDFFNRRDVKSYCYRNACCFPDYSLSPGEVEEVFAFDPGASLQVVRADIEAALALSPPQALSSRHFINMFAWQDFFDFDVEEINGAVCVFARQPAGVFMYWPPQGKDVVPAVIAACFQRMHAINRGGSLSRIEGVATGDLPLFDPRVYQVSLSGHEYIYRREDVVSLRGKAYKSRRGDVNIFKRAHPQMPGLRPYAREDFNGCAALFDRWMLGRRKQHENDVYGWMLEENRDVHRLLLAHAGALGLMGRVLEIDGDIAAYTFGYALGEDVFCVLLEVVDLSVKGLPAFVFSRFCAEAALEKYRWINGMDAMAGERLARAKMSWRPERMEPVYVVTPLDRPR
ncbi:MAG: phosphatidylglycerol lysyltransferase domain-containing protein [Candidatus Omnitrophota bacterium]